MRQKEPSSLKHKNLCTEIFIQEKVAHTLRKLIQIWLKISNYKTFSKIGEDGLRQ